MVSPSTTPVLPAALGGTGGEGVLKHVGGNSSWCIAFSLLARVFTADISVVCPAGAPCADETLARVRTTHSRRSTDRQSPVARAELCWRSRGCCVTIGHLGLIGVPVSKARGECPDRGRTWRSTMTSSPACSRLRQHAVPGQRAGRRRLIRPRGLVRLPRRLTGTAGSAADAVQGSRASARSYASAVAALKHTNRTRRTDVVVDRTVSTAISAAGSDG